MARGGETLGRFSDPGLLVLASLQRPPRISAWLGLALAGGVYLATAVALANKLGLPEPAVRLFRPWAIALLLSVPQQNPADLEQPRPETPAYTPRRDIAFDRYRKGNPSTTVYPEAEKAKLSDTGK